MKSNISKHQKFFLKTKKKRTTRKTRGFVVGAKILHLQTHSKRTNTIVTRDEYERKTIDDKTLVRAKRCSASENCLRLRRVFLKNIVGTSGLLEVKRKKSL